MAIVPSHGAKCLVVNPSNDLEVMGWGLKSAWLDLTLWQLSGWSRDLWAGRRDKSIFWSHGALAAGQDIDGLVGVYGAIAIVW